MGQIDEATAWLGEEFVGKTSLTARCNLDTFHLKSNLCSHLALWNVRQVGVSVGLPSGIATIQTATMSDRQAV